MRRSDGRSRAAGRREHRSLQPAWAAALTTPPHQRTCPLVRACTSASAASTLPEAAPLATFTSKKQPACGWLRCYEGEGRAVSRPVQHRPELHSQACIIMLLYAACQTCQRGLQPQRRRRTRQSKQGRRQARHPALETAPPSESRCLRSRRGPQFRCRSPWHQGQTPAQRVADRRRRQSGGSGGGDRLRPAPVPTLLGRWARRPQGRAWLTKQADAMLLPLWLPRPGAGNNTLETAAAWAEELRHGPPRPTQHRRCHLTRGDSGASGTGPALYPPPYFISLQVQ